MYWATAHTELVVRSAKKMMSQHFKMCTKSTTHMHSFIYSIHQHIYAVLCDMRTEVGSSCALKQWTLWWCEQCEFCTWILKKSHKRQIRRYNIWLTGLKNLKVIQEMLPVEHDKNCVKNFPFSEYARTTNICGIVIITLLSDLFVGRYSNFKITASKWGSIYIFNTMKTSAYFKWNLFPTVSLVIYFAGSI